MLFSLVMIKRSARIFWPLLHPWSRSRRRSASSTLSGALTALRALAVEYRAELEEYDRRLCAAIQRTVDAWRDARQHRE
jgi:hypothetical protein